LPPGGDLDKVSTFEFTLPGWYWMSMLNSATKPAHHTGPSSR